MSVRCTSDWCDHVGACAAARRVWPRVLDLGLVRCRKCGGITRNLLPKTCDWCLSGNGPKPTRRDANADAGRGRGRGQQTRAQQEETTQWT